MARGAETLQSTVRFRVLLSPPTTRFKGNNERKALFNPQRGTFSCEQCREERTPTKTDQREVQARGDDAFKKRMIAVFIPLKEFKTWR